jgi:putative heme-binding domain-containing protein
VGLKNRFQASRPANWEERFRKLVEHLPPADEARDKLILERRTGFNGERTSLEEGLKSYVQYCAPCHQLDGVGAIVGPQLTGIGDRGVDRLCEDILDPNRNVDHAFRQTMITMKDGESLAGLFRREEGELLVLADSAGKEVTVKKADVGEKRELDASLMPDNFGEVISPGDFNNLLAYLLSKRGTK